MAERIAQESSGQRNSPNLVTTENHLDNHRFPESEPNGNSQTSPLNRPKVRSEPAEWVVQDEPGVYITVSSLPGGGKDLRRVRFSRRRFNEKQAEAWWAENRTKVHERHDIRSATRSVTANSSMLPPPPPPPHLPKDNDSSD